VLYCLLTTDYFFSGVWRSGRSRRAVNPELLRSLGGSNPSAPNVRPRARRRRPAAELQPRLSQVRLLSCSSKSEKRGARSEE
jgi:hypothetical protein